MVGYIYITTNIVTGMKYIGKHKSSVHHNWYVGSGSLLKKDIAKYGKDKFKSEVLEECDTIDDLNERERYWIEQYNAVDDPNFYNIADGGSHSSGKGFSSAMTLAWRNQEYRESHVAGDLRYWSDEENRARRAAISRSVDHKSVWTDDLREQQRQTQIESWSDSELRKRHSKTMRKIWSNPDMINAQRERNTGSRNPSYGKHYYVDGNDNWVYCKPEDVPNGYYIAKYCWIFKDGEKRRHEKDKPIPDGWSLTP